ncbi:hypothetical protein MAR_020363, partial [Mya arenaria]
KLKDASPAGETQDDKITQLEKKLEQLRQEKHDYFSQLKKVLHQEDETRKRAQQKDEMNQPPTIYPQAGMTPVSAHPVLHHPGRPTMYRHTQSIIAPVPNVPLKRPRSPSPTPTSGYQQYENKKAATAAHYSHSTQGDFKPVTYQTQPSSVSYGSQPVHSFQQSSVAFTTTKSPAGKYQPTGQSAFTSYPSHYTQHQHPKTMEPGYPTPYQMPRIQQPGYLASPHSSNIPLQQQLQQANDKAGFSDGDKYKQLQQPQLQPAIRGAAPIQGQQPGMIPISLQQEMSARVTYPGQQPPRNVGEGQTANR